MRVAGLIGLLILSVPVFVYAADAPALTTYTISHGTIYPSATIESGLATSTTVDTAFSEPVKVSIKVVLNGATIKSLYTSSSVTNPAPKMWDGTNTAGAHAGAGTYTILISATSTATSLSMTDSSKTISIASPQQDSGSSADSANTAIETVLPVNSGSPEYVPIPALHISTDGDRTVSSGADTAFTATVYDGKGNRRDDAVVTWAFGDGMRRTGASVFHQYYNSGEYLAVVRATTADGGNTQKEVVVTVKNASIKIASISARGITLENGDSRTLDLSLWRLSMGGREFKIPEDTQILAGRTTLFPIQVTELPVADTASLLFPSGEVAATYGVASAPTIMQPVASVVSYEQVQKVEPIISQGKTPAHEEAVGAPAAANELAAAGAALPPPETTSATRLFKSPWTLGFLGTMLLAGSAFIFL